MKAKQEVPKGYAEIIKKESEKKFMGLFEDFNKGDYCGFDIRERITIGKKHGEGLIVDGFHIINKAGFNLTRKSNIAIRFGVVDTIEHAKYFIDQILYKDEEFNYMLENLEIKKELSDKKTIISLLIKNY